MFHDYLNAFETRASAHGVNLFRVLDTPIDKRDLYPEEDWLSFRMSTAECLLMRKLRFHNSRFVARLDSRSSQQGV
jgi:hypothetical protein